MLDATAGPFASLFRRHFGVEPVGCVALRADGGARRRLRLRGPDGEAAIGVEGPDADENRAFLSFSATFASLGLPVPQVFLADERAGRYLEEDLGDTTLFSALSAARGGDGRVFPTFMTPVYRRVIETLPRFQVEGARAIDFSVAYPRAAFDRRSMSWDLDYFKYHFLKLAHVPFNEDRLQRDFDRLVDRLLAVEASFFLYRDFQSRNVMLRPDAAGVTAPWFIDYQGGRRGALAYDVASLLYDAKAALPPALRDDLLSHYLAALAEHLPVDEAAFRRDLPGYVLIRILQAMGAYGYRGFFERKTHFLQSVPHALRNLEALLEAGLVDVDVPELRTVLERIVSRDDLRRAPPPIAAGLRIRLGSFSYRRGYPDADPTDGGGFVFDCRALDNPGLDPTLAPLDGRDPDVARRLEADPALAAFVAHSTALVEASLASYRARGYTRLDVHFGCTGGRHRSVYCVTRLAAALARSAPDVHVEVAHRELDARPGAIPVASWTG